MGKRKEKMALGEAGEDWREVFTFVSFFPKVWQYFQKIVLFIGGAGSSLPPRLS